MPVALEHDDRDLARLDPLRLGDALDVLSRWCVDVDDVDSLGPAGDLVHVDRRTREEHRPALGDRDHGDRVRLALGGEARALERVDRDVDLRAVAVADLLAVVEHRRLVLLALADHDDAAHLHAVEDGAHRVDGGLVGGFLLAATDPASRSHRTGLGDAHELQRDVAIRGRHGRRSYAVSR